MNQRSFCVSLQDQRICWQPVNHSLWKRASASKQISISCVGFPNSNEKSTRIAFPSWPFAPVNFYDRGLRQSFLSSSALCTFLVTDIDGSITRWWHWTPNERGSIWGLEVKKLKKSKLGKSFFFKMDFKCQGSDVGKLQHHLDHIGLHRGPAVCSCTPCQLQARSQISEKNMFRSIQTLRICFLYCEAGREQCLMCISFLAIGILKRSKKAFTNLDRIRTWHHSGQSCMNQAVQVFKCNTLVAR